jgi:hypothetical protein
MTEFPNSYIASDTILEAMIGDNQMTAAVALKAASTSSQAWFCQEATRHIDAMPLRGKRYEDEYIKNGAQYDSNNDGLAQVLEFPRVIDGVVKDWDHGTDLPVVPNDIKSACMEEAITIYAAGSGGIRESGKGKESRTSQEDSQKIKVK